MNGTLIVKPSFYNIITDKNGHMTVFNTKTGVMFKYVDKLRQNVKEIFEKKSFIMDYDNKLMNDLYENKFLVDINIDEIGEIDVLEESQVFDNYLHLIILPTEQCNFRCIYCYEKFERGKMSDTTCQDLVRFVEDNIDDYKGLDVGWFGGEPLEALDVISSLSEEFLRICRGRKKMYNAGITTNGYNLTLDVFKILKKYHVTFYQITFDGLPDDHDKQRVLANGQGTAQTIINNLVEIQKNIKSNTFQISLRTNFSKSMVENIKEYSDFLSSTFGDDSRFGIFWQVVEDYGFLKDESIKDDFCSVSDVMYMFKNYGKNFNNNVLAPKLRPNGSVCYALKKNAYVISSEGAVRKCTCDLDSEENYFGSIGDKMSIDNGKLEKWLSREITKDSKCYYCKRRPICHQRCCIKTTDCPFNFLFLDDMIEILSNNTQFCKKITEEMYA
jgi:uncharacterized protein